MNKSAKNNRIRDGWSTVELGDILQYEQPYYYTVTSTEYNDISGTPVLTAGKSFLLGYTSEITNIYSNLPVIIFDDFTTDSKYVDFPFKVKSSAMKFLRQKDNVDIDLKLIFEFIQTLRISVANSDHKRRWISEFSKIKISLPPFPEQQQIAKILSTADSVIEKTQAAVAKYKAIKQGMLQDLFTRGIDISTNKLRPRFEDAPHLYKESKLGWLPKEWDVEKLVSLCSEKPTYGINAAAVDFTYQLPTYLRITDIEEDGGFSKTGRKCVDSPFSENYILKKGDLVFARTGASVGKTYLYNEADGLLVFAGFLIKVSPNSKALDSNYLKFLTETSYYLNWVGLMSQRSAQPGINGNEYGSFLIPKPDLKEQIIISEKLLAIQRKLQTEQTYLQKMQLLKKGLMEDLLSGKIKVKSEKWEGSQN